MQLASSQEWLATQPLYVVASSGDEAAIQLLLNNGADIEQRNIGDIMTWVMRMAWGYVACMAWATRVAWGVFVLYMTRITRMTWGCLACMTWASVGVHGLGSCVRI
jgi:hypothetical protein